MNQNRTGSYDQAEPIFLSWRVSMTLTQIKKLKSSDIYPTDSWYFLLLIKMKMRTFIYVK